eukprot:scaffold49629_cov70-Phaeocystis_antarctica.AAC.3
MRLPSPCTRSTIRGARPHGVQDTNPNPNPNPNPDPNQVQGQGVQDTGAPAWGGAPGGSGQRRHSNLGKSRPTERPATASGAAVLTGQPPPNVQSHRLDFPRL